MPTSSELCFAINSGAASGVDGGSPKALADRVTCDGQQALRRCRSHSPSGHQPEAADLFPDGRKAAGLAAVRRGSRDTPPFRPNRQRGVRRGACPQSLAMHQWWPPRWLRLLLGEGGLRVAAAAAAAMRRTTLGGDLHRVRASRARCGHIRSRLERVIRTPLWACGSWRWMTRDRLPRSSLPRGARTGRAGTRCVQPEL